MYIKILISLICLFLYTGSLSVRAGEERQLSDSLQNLLSKTSDPKQRIALLLNLKDLNQDNQLDLPFSIQLFREAAAQNDTYALAVAYLPILNHFGTHAERQDTLIHYMRVLRNTTSDTEQDGTCAYTEMQIATRRILGRHDPEQRRFVAAAVKKWSDGNVWEVKIHHQIKRLISGSMAQIYMAPESQYDIEQIKQIRNLEQADSLANHIKELQAKVLFKNKIYLLLSKCYTLSHDYAKLDEISRSMIDLYDLYFAHERASGRRPYLSLASYYITPYQQLMMAAHATNQTAKANDYHQAFRRRMLAAKGSKDLIRNKSYLYQMGYKWHEQIGDHRVAMLYCDSLIGLIQNHSHEHSFSPTKIAQAYQGRAEILTKLKDHDQALEAFNHTYKVLDSLEKSELKSRMAAIRERNDLARRQLKLTNNQIYNRNIATTSLMVVVVLIFCTGVFMIRSLYRNKRTQVNIATLEKRAKESEKMKSNFVNSICHKIHAPLHTIDNSAWQLMSLELSLAERKALQGTMRTNTAQLLTTLDNLLEAANLDSFAEPLHLSPTNIDELCRAKMVAVACDNPNEKVKYIVVPEPQTRIISTHARYFGFVIRAMVENAARHTFEGFITLDYQINAELNQIRVTVTDTGCGVDTQLRDTIFNYPSETSSTQKKSLALCYNIAKQMRGDICLDQNYSPGARFIFTLPLKP